MRRTVGRQGGRVGIRRLLLLLLCTTFAGGSSRVRAADDAISDYLQRMQESGMADLALDYLDLLIESKRVPKSIQEHLDYYYGNAILEASKIAVAERERKLLDQALAHFEKYRSEHTGTDEAINALAKVASIYLARAERLLAAAKSAEKPADAAVLRKEARELIDKARPELSASIEQYAQALARAKKEGDRPQKTRGPRKAVSRADRLEGLLVGAEISRGMVEYLAAQAYDRANPEEKKKSDEQFKVALAEFDRIFQRDRSKRPMVANYALLKEGRVHQELGNYQAADDIYREIFAAEPEQTSQLSPFEFDMFAETRLSWYQTQNLWDKPERVLEDGYYSAVLWIKKNDRYRRTPIGLGIQLEIAKALIQVALKLPEKDVNRRRRFREAMGYLNDEVCAFRSPFQEEGFALRKQYAKEVRGGEGDMGTFDELVYVADTALQAQEWAEAIAAYEKCLAVAEKRKRDVSPDAVAAARYQLAYCHFMVGDATKCVENAEAVARLSPPAKASAVAGGLALTAYARLYDEQKEASAKEAMGAKLLALAEYIHKRFPLVKEADQARFVMGSLYYSLKRFDDSAAAYAQVSTQAPNYPLAQYQSGSTYYVQYVRTLKEDPTSAEAALKKANEALATATKAYEERDKESGGISFGWVQTMFKRAEIALRIGKGEEANKLCEPLVELAAKGEPPEINQIAVNILVTAIESAIATRQMKRADEIVDVVLAAPKGSDGGEKITQVLLRLGGSFRQQILALEKGGDARQGGEMKALFKQFLGKFASRPNQDFNSIRFVGESYYELGEMELAAQMFAKALEVLEAQPDVLAADQRGKARMALLLRRFSALRSSGDFDDALQIVDDLLAEHAAEKSTYALALEMEKARLFDQWSEQDSSRAASALEQWNSIANTLRSGKPKRIEYFEARYGVALAFRRLNQVAKAVQALRSTMTLSPECGGPEMKKKFERLLSELEGTATAESR